MKNFIPTSEQVEVKNYPYGFTLRTTLFDSIEFNPKKGYRHITYTINPKTGKANKPKASTYSDFLLRFYVAEGENKGHIKLHHIDFNQSFEGFEQLAKNISDVWEFISTEEKEYMIIKFKTQIRVSAHGSIVYSGTDQAITVAESKILLDYLNSFANIEEKKVKGKLQDVIVSYNVDTNIFLDFPKVDLEKINGSAPENYNPFVTKRIV